MLYSGKFWYGFSVCLTIGIVSILIRDKFNVHQTVDWNYYFLAIFAYGAGSLEGVLFKD